MEDRTITLTTSEGKDIVCDILFTYHSDQFNKDYVVFVPRGTNEASAASYIESGDGNGELQKIETEEEWKMLEELLDDYSNEQETSCSGNCGNCSGGCDKEECDCDGNCEKE
ncbi:MAG: DUF1292 domain-containing protein [Anaeroplasmataceae bacterium]|jgi:Uncharacterized protein conserved in bacteria|nr:DUF1292 domain-containing protein [Anaeroplasmataceae bacterium]HRF70924.1 DUF1292 domain-containing protein [Candidatus Pelethenecus sp.]